MPIAVENIIGYFVFAFGACIGSFLLAFQYRRHLGVSIVYPGSFCDACRTPLKPYDLIPIISFVMQRGRCRYCREKISSLNFLGEIFMGILFVYFYRSYSGFLGWFLCLNGSILFLMSTDDLLDRNIYTYDILLLLFFNLIASLMAKSWEEPIRYLILFFFIVCWFLTRHEKIRTIGEGDLLVILALMFTISMDRMLFFFLATIWSAMIYSVYLLFKGCSLKQEVPLIPFILIGYVIGNSELFATIRGIF